MLAEAKAAEQIAVQAMKDAVQPIEMFTIQPDTSPFHKTMDPAIRFYSISKRLVNKLELKAVGNDTTEGSMTYMFNAATGRFIGSTSGGHIYVSTDARGGWGESVTPEEIERVWSEIAAVVIDRPEMVTEITDIVQQHRLNKRNVTV
jgi:hypothetical protein